jgi:hypothetical protein
MERQEKKEIGMSEKKEVGIELLAPREVMERAESYAEQIDAGDKVIAALDYIAGALEERILLLEWNNANREWPDTDRQVLTKDENGCYRVAYCDGGRWSEEGVKYWREIYELD